MVKTIITERIILPLRALEQPQPFIAEKGDCSYCVLGALLGWSVSKTYEMLEAPHKGAAFQTTREQLKKLYEEDHLEKVILSVPMWFNSHNTNSAFLSFGLLAPTMSTEWFDYVTMALEAGYYGVAAVDFQKKGAGENATNHVVLICGSRTVVASKYDKEGSFQYAAHRNEVMISCPALSTPKEQWIDVNIFLRLWGGFNVALVKPN